MGEAGQCSGPPALAGLGQWDRVRVELWPPPPPTWGLVGAQGPLLQVGSESGDCGAPSPTCTSTRSKFRSCLVLPSLSSWSDLTQDTPSRIPVSVQMIHGIPSAIMENWGRLECVCCGRDALDRDSTPLGLSPASGFTSLWGESPSPLCAWHTLGTK